MTDVTMETRWLTQLFNQGFRRGANDRACLGLPLSRATQPPSDIPDCPQRHVEMAEQIAWTLGYATGYQIGASDTELASADLPGADGMISEMSEEMLEKIGAFKKMFDES
jgi:hypothetical protein